MGEETSPEKKKGEEWALGKAGEKTAGVHRVGGTHIRKEDHSFNRLGVGCRYAKN